MSVSEFIPKVYLIHKDRRRWEFTNIEIAANRLWSWGYYGRYREEPLFSSHFVESRQYECYVATTVHFHFIVRDQFGAIITPDDLYKVRDTVHQDKRRLRNKKRAEIADKHFRKLPAPNTRCHRGGGWSYYRHIRTTAEHRENDFLGFDEDAIEYDIKPRARRSQNLPTTYDDIGRSNHNAKNWKKYRKHQWKDKK